MVINKIPKDSIASRFTHLNSNQFSTTISGIGQGINVAAVKNQGVFNDQNLNLNSERDFTKHSPQIRGKGFSEKRKNQNFGGFEMYGLHSPGSQITSKTKILSPNQVNFAPGAQKNMIGN